MGCYGDRHVPEPVLGTSKLPRKVISKQRAKEEQELTTKECKE